MSKNNFFHKILAYIYYWVADKYLLRNDYVFQPKNLKSIFYLPYIRTDMIQKTIFRYKNYFENRSLSFLCKVWKDGIIGNAIKNKAVLDIGANIGNHTLYFLNECQAKFVYCFEPATDTFKILQRNVEINHLEEVTSLINAGVGSSSGKGCIRSSREGNTGFTVIEPSLDGDVRIVAIDDMNICESIGLVKIDVEGFEVEVLEGMLKTIEQNMPFMMIEVDNTNQNSVFSILERYGYKHISLNIYGKNANYLFYPV